MTPVLLAFILYHTLEWRHIMTGSRFDWCSHISWWRHQKETFSALLAHCSGPVFCLLLGVSSGCAWPITGQVTSVTWPVIGWAYSLSLLRARDRKRAQVTGEFPSQRPVTLMFSLIYTRINGCVSNRDTGDWRRHRAYYDVTVMFSSNGRSGVQVSFFELFIPAVTERFG